MDEWNGINTQLSKIMQQHYVQKCKGGRIRKMIRQYIGITLGVEKRVVRMGSTIG